MSVAVCHDAWAQIACMYDTTTGEAFGPVFTGPAAGEGAEEFLTWLRENGSNLPEHLGGIHLGHRSGGEDARDWLPESLRRIVEHFQNTVLDTVEGHHVDVRIIPSAGPEDEDLLGEIDPTGKGFQPTAYLTEDGRIVPMNTLPDTVEGHEIEGSEPDGLRMEGGRIVPTDR